MGGNALSCTSVRLPHPVYAKVARECLAILRTLYPQGLMEAIEAYRQKPDFGDLDILISDEAYHPQCAAEALGATELVRNGPVTSLGIRLSSDYGALSGALFQIDLIRSTPEEFPYTARYFKWNDAGNLIGRIAHAGFTAHRHDGLYFYFRDPAAPDHLFRDILLTRNHDAALQYLGYDPAPFNAGFETLEDIFTYVASSTFFNRDIYLLENRNTVSRARDRKRPTYMKFLAWCEAHPELPFFEYPKEKTAWMPRLYEHFPQFHDDHAQALEDLARVRAVKAKFNGGWVTEITGLQGKALGAVMQRFKASFASAQEQYAYVLEQDTATLAQRVRAIQKEIEEEPRRSSGPKGA